jgi:hypothetical protein
MLSEAHRLTARSGRGGGAATRMLTRRIARCSVIGIGLIDRDLCVRALAGVTQGQGC